jgi:hypothetical protein
MNAGKFQIAAAAILIIVLVATGCTGLPGGTAQKSIQVAPSENTAGDSYSTSSHEGIMQGGSWAVPVPTPAPTISSENAAGTTGQKIVYTADAQIEVQNVTRAVETLKALASGKGGYLASSNINTQSARRYANVVLRVPAGEFENVIAGVKEIGDVRSLSTSGEDVTAEYVDLLARKASYQNQIAQYNEIMKRSEKVEDVIKVQEQLDRVQTELDSLEGRLRYMNNRIDLSTITIRMNEPEPVGSTTGHSFINTLNTGIEGLIGMIDFLVIVIITLLPLIAIAVIVYAVYRWHMGRKPPGGKEPPVQHSENKQ